jgi:hypothetical protein
MAGHRSNSFQWRGLGVSYYREAIREEMAQLGRVGAADPRWVEGWMRLERGCLDGLSAGQFRTEVGLALECIAAASARDNENLAQSYGL